jgi:hypothetical protein
MSNREKGFLIAINNVFLNDDIVIYAAQCTKLASRRASLVSSPGHAEVFRAISNIETDRPALPMDYSVYQFAS